MVGACDRKEPTGKYGWPKIAEDFGNGKPKQHEQRKADNCKDGEVGKEKNCDCSKKTDKHR